MKNPVEIHLLNEHLMFESFIDEQFMVMKFNYSERREIALEEKEELVYLFFEDLMNKNKLKINYANTCVINIYYDFKVPFKPKFDDYEKVSNTL